MAPPLVIGRYEVLDRLGKGGMGEVYLARDPNIVRLVALKLLPRSLDSGELRERFTREARAAGALGHPNIVTIHDFGEWQGAPFLVMEYIRGETIEGLIKRRAVISLRRKLQLLEQLCAGLGCAHAVGVIHRDIKPANLMVDQHGLLKILDFGIARLVDAQTQLTVAAIGTPRYMSPEQIDGREIDARSDIFSAGAVAFELLTYTEAFSGDTARTVMRRVQEYTPPPVSSLCREAGPEIDRIVARALEKNAGHRFPDILVMQAALQSVASQLGSLDYPVRDGVQAPSSDHRALSKFAREEDLDTLPRKDPARVAALLVAARTALTNRDYDTAMTACQDALVIDSTNAETLALIREVHLAIDTVRKLDLLAQARVELAAGNLTKANTLVGEALALDPVDSDAVTLRHGVDQARRVREDARWQARVVREACEHAQRCYDNAEYERALAYAHEALAQDPDNPQAQAIRRWCVEASTPTVPTPPPRSSPLPGASASAQRPRWFLAARRIGLVPAALTTVALLSLLGSLFWWRASTIQPTPGPPMTNGPTPSPGRKTAAGPGPAAHQTPGSLPADRLDHSPSNPPRNANAPVAGEIPPPRPELSPTAEDHLARGDALRARGQFDAAITEYEAVLGADPANRRARAGRAAAVEAKVMTMPGASGASVPHQNARVDEEVRLLREADRLLAAGDYAEAVSAYDRVLAVNPKNERAIVGKRNAVEAKVMRDRSR
jgi:serine/threonine protein kinase